MKPDPRCQKTVLHPRAGGVVRGGAGFVRMLAAGPNTPGQTAKHVWRSVAQAKTKPRLGSEPGQSSCHCGQSAGEKQAPWKAPGLMGCSAPITGFFLKKNRCYRQKPGTTSYVPNARNLRLTADPTARTRQLGSDHQDRSASWPSSQGKTARRAQAFPADGQEHRPHTPP